MIREGPFVPHLVPYVSSRKRERPRAIPWDLIHPRVGTKAPFQTSVGLTRHYITQRLPSGMGHLQAGPGVVARRSTSVWLWPPPCQTHSFPTPPRETRPPDVGGGFALREGSGETSTYKIGCHRSILLPRQLLGSFLPSEKERGLSFLPKKILTDLQLQRGAGGGYRLLLGWFRPTVGERRTLGIGEALHPAEPLQKGPHGGRAL